MTGWDTVDRALADDPPPPPARAQSRRPSIADGLIAAGTAIVAIGFGWIWTPLAFVAVGAGMIVVGVLAARRERVR